MTLWGGRFAAAPDRVMWSYTASTADRRLLVDDIRGSLAHVSMLGRVGLLNEEELSAITAGLRTILAEAESGRFEFGEDDEDVHSAVERRLIEIVGAIGGKLHTGRSRNDQVALDLRMYLRGSAGDRAEQLAGFALLLADLAEAAGETVVPVYTHLQQAQSIPLGHHLLAHGWAVVRDRERFLDCRKRLDVSPLGAGAAGGSGLPLDPELVAADLGFGGYFANSIDAVGARDWVAEYVFCCGQAMVGLSRLAEELVLWATSEFGWVTFSDAATTGSSALPHKKNPDIAELARGRAAAAIGDVTTLLALQKGLPLAYNRDLQEDKAVVFHADDLLGATLTALAVLLRGARFDPPLPEPWVGTLDLAERLVERGVPFREAHRSVGRLVSLLLAEGRDLSAASDNDLAAVDARFDAADLEALDPAASVRRRISPGGGSFASVAQQVERLRRLLSVDQAEPPSE